MFVADGMCNKMNIDYQCQAACFLKQSVQHEIRQLLKRKKGEKLEEWTGLKFKCCLIRVASYFSLLLRVYYLQVRPINNRRPTCYWWKVFLYLPIRLLSHEVIFSPTSLSLSHTTHQPSHLPSSLLILIFCC